MTEELRKVLEDLADALDERSRRVGSHYGYNESDIDSSVRVAKMETLSEVADAVRGLIPPPVDTRDGHTW